MLSNTPVENIADTTVTATSSYSYVIYAFDFHGNYAAGTTVITNDLVTNLAKMLAFRHLFRGASIALMRWNKLSPLVASVDGVHKETVRELNQFQRFLRMGPTDPVK